MKQSILWMKESAEAALHSLAERCPALADPSGGMYAAGAFGGIRKENCKTAVLQFRALYGLSALYEVAQDARCAELAERQLRFLAEHFVDAEYGGVWTELDARGVCCAPEKGTYENAFALYALAQYARVFASREALEMAQHIFFAMEAARGPHDGYADCYDRAWSGEVLRRCGRARAPVGMFGLDNQMHVLEAYENLYRVWTDARLHKRLEELTALAARCFVTTDRVYAGPCFDAAWKVCSEDESFGDDAELAWLMIAAERRIHQQPRGEILRTAEKLVERVLTAGMDREYGGVYDAVRSNTLQDRKVWWTQCEAVNACLSMYQMTQEETYLEKAASIWRFLTESMILPDGSWRGYVCRDGKPPAQKTPSGPPVCLYHNVRVCTRIGQLTCSNCALQYQPTEG